MLHTTEEALKDHFNRSIGACDAVERVKKIRDYAFVHFRDRIQAAAALHQLDGRLPVIVSSTRVHYKEMPLCYDLSHNVSAYQ